MYYKKVCYKGVTTRDHETTTRIKGFRASTEFIELYEDGRLIIRKGYGTDFTSGPTWDDDYTKTPALEHDAKYQLLRLGLIPMSCRVIADEELKEGIVFRYRDKNFFLRKVGQARAAMYFVGVDRFAAFAAKYGTEPKEEFAP